MLWLRLSLKQATTERVVWLFCLPITSCYKNTASHNFQNPTLQDTGRMSVRIRIDAVEICKVQVQHKVHVEVPVHLPRTFRHSTMSLCPGTLSSGRFCCHLPARSYGAFSPQAQLTSRLTSGRRQRQYRQQGELRHYSLSCAFFMMLFTLSEPSSRSCTSNVHCMLEAHCRYLPVVPTYCHQLQQQHCVPFQVLRLWSVHRRRKM